MEIGVPRERDLKLAQLSQQKISIEKKLESAMERAEIPHLDDEVKRWSFHLLETEKGINRLINGD